MKSIVKLQCMTCEKQIHAILEHPIGWRVDPGQHVPALCPVCLTKKRPTKSKSKSTASKQSTKKTVKGKSGAGGGSRG